MREVWIYRRLWWGSTLREIEEEPWIHRWVASESLWGTEWEYPGQISPSFLGFDLKMGWVYTYSLEQQKYYSSEEEPELNSSSESVNPGSGHSDYESRTESFRSLNLFGFSGPRGR